ncbi:hypothetical protein [Snodgrassella alvi]|jgi:hypothetical protein|uniref:hypothetical protein n=1 Tax=Snodgrassella alvi TaxID=1196083 RepID=UPI00118593F1|nr:hypothetical protein [Snodgrassella alvi]
MSDSFELMLIYISIVFSLGLAFFIASCDNTALSKGKQFLRHLSFANFLGFGVVWLLFVILSLFN